MHPARDAFPGGKRAATLQPWPNRHRSLGLCQSPPVLMWLGNVISLNRHCSLGLCQSPPVLMWLGNVISLNRHRSLGVCQSPPVMMSLGNFISLSFRVYQGASQALFAIFNCRGVFYTRCRKAMVALTCRAVSPCKRLDLQSVFPQQKGRPAHSAERTNHSRWTSQSRWAAVSQLVSPACGQSTYPRGIHSQEYERGVDVAR